MKGLRPKQAAGGCVLGLLAFLGSRLLLRRLKPMDTPIAAIPLLPPPADDQLAPDDWTRALAAHGAALRHATSPADALRHADAIRALVLAELGRFGDRGPGIGDWGLGIGELAEISAARDGAAADSIDPPPSGADQPPAAEAGAIGPGAADPPIDAPALAGDAGEALPSAAPDADQPAGTSPAAPSAADRPDPWALTPDPWAQAEALLFVAPEPLEGAALARALGLGSAEWAERLPEFRRHFAGRGIRVQEIDDRFQLVSAPEAGPLLEGFFGAQGSSRLSAAALEVLAIVAYRQPLTRAQIEAVRGVDSSGVLRALLTRELVQEIGRAETVGRPILYGTTPQFLQLFGLERLADLPEIDIPEPPPLDPAAD